MEAYKAWYPDYGGIYMTLQQSIEKGQKEFDKLSNGEGLHYACDGKTCNCDDITKQFLATFARHVAEDMAEEVRLEEVHHKIGKDFGLHEPFTCMYCGQDEKYNIAVFIQSQLISKYMEGKNE